MCEQNCRNSCIKGRLNFKPIEFEGLRHNQKVQRAAAQLRSITTDHEFVQRSVAQLPSGQNKKRPPLTMEPSIDDPLAAVKGIMRHPYFYVNNSTEAGGVTI